MSIWIWHHEHWTAMPWTLWTAALVHLSTAHALANLVALACLWALARIWALGLTTLGACLIAWPLSVVALAAWPGVETYAGLSGPLHGVAVILVLHRLRALWPQLKPEGYGALALALGLSAKLVWEAAWRQPVAWHADWGFPVVYAAHLSGAVVGALCAWVIAPRSKVRPQ
jgi:rhomboid family GlyGly-CTERM serine protease